MDSMKFGLSPPEFHNATITAQPQQHQQWAIPTQCHHPLSGWWGNSTLHAQSGYHLPTDQVGVWRQSPVQWGHQLRYIHRTLSLATVAGSHTQIVDTLLVSFMWAQLQNFWWDTRPDDKSQFNISIFSDTILYRLECSNWRVWPMRSWVYPMQNGKLCDKLTYINKRTLTLPRQDLPWSIKWSNTGSEMYKP